jgi:acetyltransferase-like isoleucine patch superfamily enzyme
MQKNETSGFIGEFLRNHWAGIVTRVSTLYWQRVLKVKTGGFVVGGRIRIKRPYNVSVGEDVHFAEGVYINARAPVKFGDHVRVSAFVRINTGGLDLDGTPAERISREHTSAPVVIGDHVWLATGVMVNAGVTIGSGVVVGAGAIVTKDLPPNTLCLGIPAKPVRDLPA